MKIQQPVAEAFLDYPTSERLAENPLGGEGEPRGCRAHYFRLQRRQEIILDAVLLQRKNHCTLKKSEIGATTFYPSCTSVD